MLRVFSLITFISLLAPASACTSDDKTRSEIAAPAKEKPMYVADKDGGVANLPYAQGNVFYTLDDYLAHLEKLSAIDLPYWREIKPGVYEHVIRMPGSERETATREELMKRFGFKG